MYEILIYALAHCKNVMFRSAFRGIQLKMGLEIKMLGFQIRDSANGKGVGRKPKMQLRKES